MAPRIPSTTARITVFALLLLLAALPATAQWWSGDRGLNETFQPIAKTVGTTPGVCTNDSSITVPAETTVYYCYSLSNPPPYNYTYNVTDDILGPIAQGMAGPNETFAFLEPQQIFANVTNIGTFDFFVDSGNGTVLGRGGMSASFNDSATVGVVDNGSGGSGQYNPAIPTLSEIALFSFGILLIGGAFLVLRRTA